MAMPASQTLAAASFLLPLEPPERFLCRPDAAACAALSGIPTAAQASQQKKPLRASQTRCVAVMVQHERADMAGEAGSRGYGSSAAAAVAAAVAGFASDLAAENESYLLENGADSSIIGRELEFLRSRLLALERSVLEAQWSSLAGEKAWRDDVTSPFENAERTNGLDVNVRDEESCAGMAVGTVRSGRPSARKRRLKARRELGLGCERPATVYPKLQTVSEGFDEDEKHGRCKRGKVSRGFQAFFLRDNKKKQLTEAQQRVLWDRIRSARHLIEGKKRLQSQLGSEPSEGVWASYMSISQQELLTTLREAKVAQNKLVNANLRLVVAVARRYQNLGMDLADLIQEGTVGLVKGVEKFDSTRGYKFSTYAHWWILQGITRALARMSRAIRLPYHLHETVCRIRKIQSIELGTEPDTLENLSKALKLPCTRVELALKASNYKLKSMDEPLPGNNYDLRENLHHFVADPQKENQPWLMVETAYAKEYFEKYVKAHLLPREHEIVQLRYGLSQQYVYPVTRDNIGAFCGLSRERVRQLEQVAICKLKSSKEELTSENLNLAFVRSR
ncbi:hypothetical protein O6H91_07G095100 [Diphasiastrum complanatum]|uniref:Uncharacterized protein n=2 Tax=Diphasiastrum complanatum TaxID=34168 RepID=A0ACC2D884_DIPCM|nr:hypothetical protein O6H91_07G095100 [Diphasiastrum complanatum]KAJ7550325.1 hypothetical protein O6H91_07G095100 [Diphasiastrum complanatum]